MKGTEKQVKWAEDIINKAMTCVQNNIENCKGNKALEREVPAWEYMAERMSTMFNTVPQFSDASFVISHRDNAVFHPVELMGQIETIRTNKGITYAEAAKVVLG